MGSATRVAGGSIGIGVIVLALKAAGWWITGSAGLYSDALESVVNVASAVLALAALLYAARPADANHTYGHGKVEFFAAVIEGALVILAAVSILFEAWRSFHALHDLHTPWRGLALSAVATVLNAGWGVLLLRTGRQAHSPALLADGRHLLADVVTSIGVGVGVGVVALTGLVILDPLVAVLTAAHVLWSGIRMIVTSIDGLMDAVPSAQVVDQIRLLVSEHAEGALEAHDLRTRHTGRTTYLEFHLVVPGIMRVDEAHRICDRIEGALKREMDTLVVTIHVEPEGKAKHQGVLVL